MNRHLLLTGAALAIAVTAVQPIAAQGGAAAPGVSQGTPNISSPGGPAQDGQSSGPLGAAYDIWMTAKYSKDDTDLQALFQVTKGAGAITVGGANNNVATITVAATLTSPLTTDVSVFYDVQIKAPGGSGQVSTVADGTLAIARDVTRATS